MASGPANPALIPPHLTAILEDFQKSDDAARRITAGLSDAQANWQPNPTAWSIAQCLDHMARGNTLYAAALHKAVKESRAPKKPQSGSKTGPIQPGWFGRFFIRTLDAPPKRKMKAPSKIVPASQVPVRDVLDAFLRSHEDMRAVVRDSTDLDLNRIRFRNPFIGI